MLSHRLIRFIAFTGTAIFLLCSCKGGGTLTVGVISGPAAISENTSAQYSVEVSGGTGLIYAWAVDPAAAGSFIDGDKSAATFEAGSVTEDTEVEVRIVVTSKESGPVLKTLKITITNGPDISEIFGPSSMYGYDTAQYSVAASGETDFTFHWEVDPPDAGIFSTPDMDFTDFEAGIVEVNTSVRISVTVTSDDFDPVVREKTVLIREWGIDYYPEPFAGVSAWGTVLDIGIEGDGDIVFATESGLQLYTSYGVLKRTMSPDVVFGLASAVAMSSDTGRGIMGVGPDGNCKPQPYYDDPMVEGGVPYVTYNTAWWNGEPDPFYPDTCVPVAATAPFESCGSWPAGFAYHPVTEMAFQKVNAPVCIADSDCDWPETNVVDPAGAGPGILAYHPLAPMIPDMNFSFFQGSVDFVVYYDGSYHESMVGLAVFLGVSPCIPFSASIEWNPLNPPYFHSTRDGMIAECIADFEFDMLGRLIIALPAADGIAITDPVVFPQNIRIQQVLGGRQNGMGVLPGEFIAPQAVAIDPRNQNILVSDTGNGRVQIFDHDGNFIREFGGNDTSFTPGAIRVDAFGAIYVANIGPGASANGDSLRIYSEYGTPVIYGTIEGWVYDRDSGLPIDNARVRISATFVPLDTFTDPDGHFIFPAVASGSHTVIADKYGFASESTVAFVTGGYKTVVDIYMERVCTPGGYGQVTGTVMSSLTNQPVTGMTVEIVGEAVSNITNGDGEFTLYTVPEGDQSIRLSVAGIIYLEKYITVVDGGIVDMGFLWLPVP